MQLVPRVAAIPGSTNLALHARAQELQARFGDVVNMSVGEPDCPAPAAVRARAIEKIESGDVRYTAAAGTPSLRAAIARHVAQTRGISVEPSEICVCHSAKHAISESILALVEPGDEVLLLRPSWLSYLEQIRFAGGAVGWVESRPDCGPDFDKLRAAIGPRTKGILVNSPNNPSGYVWTAAEMAALAELALQHDLWILSDEIYRRIVFDGRANPSPLSLGERVRARSIVVDGASKAFAMTGYRIGYLVAPAPIAAGIASLQSHLTGSPNAISQAALESALAAEPPEVARMVASYAERRDFLVPALRELGMATPWPAGAYYALSDVRPWLADERGRGVDGFCEDLLSEERVALVPGHAFGIAGHVRLSFAAPMEALREAVVRLERFLARRAVERAR